jgi:2-oxoglutarate dehydrogenase E2 component (dihydrolipoamide succinyltransferase)
MPANVVVPPVGDSISEVVIGEWRKRVGEAVAIDEGLVEVESEKSTFDVPAPVAGVVTQVLKQTGDRAAIGDLIAVIDPAAVPTVTTAPPTAPVATPVAAAPGEPRIMPSAAGGAGRR